jgi:hypothetical protein
MKQAFIDMFNGLKVDFPSAVVAVVNGTFAAQGFVTYDISAEMGNLVKESVSGECQVLCDEIGPLSYASLVKLGDRYVYVTGQNIDALNVVNRFTFTSTSPATGEVLL